MDQTPRGSEVAGIGSPQMEKENDSSPNEPLSSLSPGSEPDKGIDETKALAAQPEETRKGEDQKPSGDYPLFDLSEVEKPADSRPWESKEDDREKRVDSLPSNNKDDDHERPVDSQPLSDKEDDRGKALSPDKSPEDKERFTLTLIKPLGDPVLERNAPLPEKEAEDAQSEPSSQPSPVDAVKLPAVQSEPIFPLEPLVTSTPVCTNVNVEAKYVPPPQLASFVHPSPGDRPSVQAGVVDQSNNVYHPISKSPDHANVDHAVAAPKVEECSANVAAFQPVQLEKPSAQVGPKAVDEVQSAGPPSEGKATEKAKGARPTRESAKTTGQTREKAHAAAAQAAKKGPPSEKGAAPTERKPREARKTLAPAPGTRRVPPESAGHPAARRSLRPVTEPPGKGTPVANGGGTEAKPPPSKATAQPKVHRRSEAKSADRTRPNLTARQKPPAQVKSSAPAPKPEIKNAQPRVGSLENAKHKPTTTGRIQIQSRKLDFSKTAKSKIGSLDNIKYKPAGGNVKIFEQKLNFKSKAHSKVTAENEKAAPSKSSEAPVDETTKNGTENAAPATSLS